MTNEMTISNHISTYEPMAQDMSETSNEKFPPITTTICDDNGFLHTKIRHTMP